MKIDNSQSGMEKVVKAALVMDFKSVANTGKMLLKFIWPREMITVITIPIITRGKVSFVTRPMLSIPLFTIQMVSSIKKVKITILGVSVKFEMRINSEKVERTRLPR
jgi:hypothetical protein